MSNPNELVLCVPSEVFGPLEGYESLKRLGFNATQTNARVKRLREYLKSGKPIWKRKGLVETNEKFQQIIPYVVITFGNGDIFSYQRGSVGEKAIAGQKFVGGRGPRQPSDLRQPLIRCDDPLRETLYTAALREMEEELKPNRQFNPRDLTVRGFLRLNKTKVDRVHVAVVFEYHYRAGGRFPIYRPTPEIQNGVFNSVDFVRKQNEAHQCFEPWSQTLLPILRQDFNIA